MATDLLNRPNREKEKEAELDMTSSWRYWYVNRDCEGLFQAKCGLMIL